MTDYCGLLLWALIAWMFTAVEVRAETRLIDSIFEGRDNTLTIRGKVARDCEKFVNQYIYERVQLRGLYWTSSDPNSPKWYFGSVRNILKKFRVSFLEVDESAFRGMSWDYTENSNYWKQSRYAKIYIAPSSSPYCKITEWEIKRHPELRLELVSDGLRPDECIAVEPANNLTASHGVNVQHRIHGAKYTRMQLRSLADNKVLAENLSIVGTSFSDKFGGYACENNLRAFANDFPWNAIDVPAHSFRERPKYVRYDKPPDFPRMRVFDQAQLKRVEPLGQDVNKSFQREFMSSDASLGILWHRTLLIAYTDKTIQLPLPQNLEAGSYFSVKIAKNEIYVLGWGPKFVVLRFTRDGEPIEAHQIISPRWERAEHETNGFELVISPDSYRIRIHVGPGGANSLLIRRTYELDSRQFTKG